MPLDKLKRPISVGDTVLTQGYGTTNMRAICPVLKVLKDHVIVELPQRDTQRRSYNYKGPHPELMKRSAYECIVINEQLTHNRATWPENYL